MSPCIHNLTHPCICPQRPIGASSTASTVPGSDADAIANARRGCEEARRLADQTRCTTPRPTVSGRPAGIVRVNSVPVLSPGPATPVDKIRRTLTPTPQLPSLPAHAGNESVPTAGVVSLAESHQMQREAILNKRQEVAANPVPPQVPAPNAQVAEPSAALALGDDATSAGAGGDRPKASARKAAAKPPVRHTDQPHDSNLAAEVKSQPTPCRNDLRDDQARKQACLDNMARANTASQLGTPSHGADTPRSLPGSAATGDASTLPSASDDGTSQSAAEGAAGELDDAAREFEEALDRAIKTEPGATANDAPASADAAPAPLPAPTKPVRKEKTPAQKAAHARYMRFSRSFERILSMHM